MIPRPPRPARRSGPKVRREMLVNWLALLALLALGVIWPGDDTGDAGASRARTAMQGGTTIREAQAPRGYALP